MEKPILTYVTSNDRKFAEAQRIFPHIQRLSVELPEIQSLNNREVIRAKLSAVKEKVPDAKDRIIIVEDGANYFEGFGKNSLLPGTLVKYFLDELGAEGLWKIAQAFEVKHGHIELMVGVLEQGAQESFFEGVITGNIVAPRGSGKFGFDPIFQPDGTTKTFAEMTMEEKNKISHRGIALRKVREYLKKQHPWQFPPL